MVDEDILGVVRRLEGRRMAGKLLLFLGLLAAVAGLTRFIPGDPADAGAGRLLIFGAAAAVFIAAGCVLLLVGRMPPEATTGRVAMIRAERLQSRRQGAFLLMPLSLFFMLTGVIRAASHAMAGIALRHVEIFSVGCFVFFLVLFALGLSGRGLDRWARPVLDDELSRELRSRALRLGYLILMPGVAALFAVGLYRRDLAVELTPVLGALGVGLPALRLYFLERSAGALGAEP